MSHSESTSSDLVNSVALDFYSKLSHFFSLELDCNFQLEDNNDFIHIQLKHPILSPIANLKCFTLCNALAYHKGVVYRQATSLIDSDYFGKPVFRCLRVQNAPMDIRHEGQLQLVLFRFFDTDPGNLASFNPAMFSSLAEHSGHLVKRFSISSLGANGIDVCLQDAGLPDRYFLPAQGCLPICLPFLGSYGFRDTPGLFILRSRFSRLGCDMVHLSNNKLLVRNLSNSPVALGNRFIQIVPPWPWNFSRLPECMQRLDLDGLTETKVCFKEREEKEFV